MNSLLSSRCATHGNPGPMHCDGMAISPEADASKRAYYARMLISRLLHFIQELAAKTITITKFYATSVTPIGIAILKNASFQDIGQIGKHIPFELDVMNSDARLAKQYRAILNKKVDAKAE